MQRCMVCGAKHRKSDIFCTQCGHIFISQKFCSECGAQLDKKAKYCVTCGKQVEMANRVENVFVSKLRKKSYLHAGIILACVSILTVGLLIRLYPKIKVQLEKQTLESSLQFQDSKDDSNLDTNTDSSLKLLEGKKYYDGQFTYCIKDGGAIILDYYRYSDIESEIPDKLGGYPVTEIGDEAFAFTSIAITTLPNTVKKIGDRAFNECNGIKQLELPQSVTCIGEEAFSRTNIEKLTFEVGGAGESNLVYIGDKAFQYCGLSSVSIPEGVTYIGDEVFQANSTPQKGIPLCDITLPSSLSHIGRNAFSSNYRVNINIAISPDNKFFCIENGALFSYDRTILYQLFRADLSEYSVPDSVTTIKEGAFLGCSLEKLVISKNVSYIGEGVLDSLYSSKPDRKYDETSQTGLILSKENKYYTISDDVLFTSDGTLLHTMLRERNKYTVPDGVKRIGSGAFGGMGLDNGITIPYGVTSIGDYAFCGCGFKNIIIPDSVTEMGKGAFSYYSETITLSKNMKQISPEMFIRGGLNSIDIPYGIEKIGDSAFRYCDLLTSVTIPDSVVSIDDYAFAYCELLKNIDCSDNLKEIGNGVFHGSYIENIVLPESLTTIGNEAFIGSHLSSLHIPASVRSVGKGAFSDSYLETVVIDNGLEEISGRMFFECSYLKSITLPESIKRIGVEAFVYTQMRSIILPENLVEIGEGAFKTCDGLAEVTIPNSVRSIGDFAFASCATLKKVTIPSGVTAIGEDAFEGNEGMVIYTTIDSYAYKYARSHGILCEIID